MADPAVIGQTGSATQNPFRPSRPFGDYQDWKSRLGADVLPNPSTQSAQYRARMAAWAAMDDRPLTPPA
jgi:hypothetical protein